MQGVIRSCLDQFTVEVASSSKLRKVWQALLGAPVLFLHHFVMKTTLTVQFQTLTAVIGLLLSVLAVNDAASPPAGRIHTL